MSELPRASKPNLPRSRPIIVRRPEELIRGSASEAFEQPAGALLAGIPWEGLDPDPDGLPAQAFLGWL